MTSDGLLRNTVVVSAILAVVAGTAVALAGHVLVGAALAAGMLLGSLNGFLIQGLLARRAPFAAASLLRIVFFSSIVLVAALSLRDAAWAVALGIALAQLVMVAAGVKAGLRR
ncbi:MAG TPA: hypothetical protein VJR46_02035 [Candidatus Dormibacteraeota bacterium]|nr:hypothetical protein [Candidatus Dormibacteraeota bacterium]